MTEAGGDELLSLSCLFCEPARHGQRDRVVFRSDSLYVFAGMGAIADGYLIITPYSCDGDGDGGSPFRSIADIPIERLDELRFLRGVISRFYRARYGEVDMSFEHGRAGACLVGDGEQRHCYHAHLCCYPLSIPLWEEIKDLKVEPIDGLHALGGQLGSAPYLYMEHMEVDQERSAQQAARERWVSRVVRLSDEGKLESQFLRRLLAGQVGRPQLWDWRNYPMHESANQVVAEFREWLTAEECYVLVDGAADGIPTLDYHRSVLRLNVAGNDAVAESYHRTWKAHIQYDAVARFVKQLKVDWVDPPLILDAGCGPGIYLDALRHLGLRCVGTDIAPRMLDLARQADGEGVSLVMMENERPGWRAGVFDGIWYSAGLVHMPHSRLMAVLEGFHHALKAAGVLYLSVQIGRGLAIRWEGRVFFYYTESELLESFRASGFEVQEQWGRSTAKGSMGDTREKIWKHYVLRRRTAPAGADEEPPGKADRRTLGSMGERAIIDHLRERLPAVGDQTSVLDIGDDCTAVRVPQGEVLVATVDPCPQPVISLLEGPDPWVTGWYTMAINLSDLAAMGATPTGALLSIEAPPEQTLADLDRFYEGIGEAARTFGFPVLGGNVKDAPRFSCTATALGHARPDRLLRRDAARPGESLLVLGTMGRFWAAVLRALHAVELDAEQAALLRAAMRKPVPRVVEGIMLAAHGWSRCAMDSSDGLTACFYGLATAGDGVDVHIDLSEVEPEPAVAHVADAVGIDVRKLMLAWGDWQLVCTADLARTGEITDAMRAEGCPVWEVGWISAGRGRVWLHDADQTGTLNYVASERFTTRSYFTHGIEEYARILREEPLVK